MAALSDLQSGSITIAAGSASQTATVTAIVLANSFLRFSWYTATTSDAVGAVRGNITDTMTLTFTRNTTTTAITVDWEVVEFSSGVTTQRGSVTHSSATTNVTISAVTTAKSWPIVTFSTADTTWSASYVGIQASITTTTNLALVSNAASSNVVEWQVIQYDNCTSALYSPTINNDSLGGTQAITSVTQNKTLLFDSFYADDDPHTPENFGRWALTSATVVTYTNPADSGTGSHYHKLYVVSFTDSIAVQRASTSLAVGGTTTTTATVTSITVANTFIHILGAYGTCSATGYATNGFPRNACTCEITNTTTITLTRNTGTSASTCSWELIDFTGISSKTRSWVIWFGI